MKEELNAVVEQFLPRIKRLAKRLHALYPSVAVDDLQQVGTEGLRKAWDRYDPEKGALGTFAHPWIKGEMRMHIRKDAAKHRFEREAQDAITEVVQRHPITSGQSLAEAVFEVADAHAMSTHSRRTPEDELVTQEVFASVQAFLSKLSERDREFFHLRFIEGMILDDVGAQLGLSRASMSRTDNRMRAELRLHLTRSGC